MITANLTYEGKPIEVLNKLIAERSRQLRQTVKEATVAVGINALKSIRVMTSNAKNRKKFSIKVEDTGYYLGFSNSEKRPCIRTGLGRYAPKVKLDGRVVFLSNGLRKIDCHVYKVTYEKEALGFVYIVCGSEKIAYNYALNATKKRIESKGALAKNALGVAIGKMASISPLEGSSFSRKKASELSRVFETDSGNNYSIVIRDELDYATEALKGGESSVDTALMKAANKVYGQLAKFGSMDFTERFPQAPFPEVQRKRT